MSWTLIGGHSRTKDDLYPDGIQRLPGRQRRSAATAAWNCLGARGQGGLGAAGARRVIRGS